MIFYAEHREVNIKKDNSFLMALLAAVMLAIIVVLIVVTKDYRTAQNEPPNYVKVMLIDIDGEARSGAPREDVNDIVIHYVGVPGTSADKNLELCNEGDTQAAPHFIIGLKGEIIQCIPLTEEASMSKECNRDSIAIEVCHPDESGEFTEASYKSLVELTAWLCDKYGLTENNVIRHYDITGMECPLYFVENETAWNDFRVAVRENIK